MTRPIVAPEPRGALSVASASARVLVVDDDPALRRAVTRALELEGFEVDVAADGLEAVAFFEGREPRRPELVVLDLLMPNLDGLAACRRIRGTSDVPILMLTARSAVEERVEGLEAGADDYLVKPFAVVELIARARALLRRLGSEQDTLRYADLELDRAERHAARAGRSLKLTRIEFALLELFLSHPRRVLPREVIFRSVWGYDMNYASNSLEVYVGYLRRKTEAAGEPRLIQTVRGAGYALREAS